MKSILVLFGLWAALLGPAGDARAHAVLLETEPVSGARLTEAPNRIVLRFSEPVVPIDLRLLGDAGSTPPLSDVRASGDDLIAVLPHPLGSGSYLVSYRVRSTDAHPVSGSITFTVGDVAAALTTPANTDDALWRAAGFVVRTLLYACLLAVAGARLLTVVASVPDVVTAALARPLRRLTLTALVLAIAFLGIADAGLIGGSPAVLLTVRPWMLPATSPIGVSLAVAGLGLLLLLWENGTRSIRLRAVGAGLIALSFALSGHAETAASRWVTVPAIALHALCAAFWLGALWPLLIAVRRLRAAQAAAVLETFSHYALAMVAMLVVAGTVLVFLQLNALSDLIDTAYGQRLGLKLMAVCGLLGLAAVNRFMLTPRLRTDPPALAANRLRATLTADLVLAAVVVGLTASLSLDPPPRALASHAEHSAAPRADYAVHTSADGRSLVAVVAPARRGTNQLTLYFSSADAQPLAPKEVDVRWSLPSLGLEPLRAVAAAQPDGTYRIDTMNLPAPGRWDLRVDALIDDFTKVIFHARLDIDEAPIE
jgi:copper transport protein